MITKKELQCKTCQQNAELPHVPKINLSPTTPSNLAFMIVITTPTMRSASVDLSVIKDPGNLPLKLAHLPNGIGQTTFHAFLPMDFYF